MSEVATPAPVAPEAAGAASPAPEPAPIPAPPPAPDSVVLTRREFDTHIQKAVALAIENAQSRTMAKPEETTPPNPPAPAGPTAEDFAKLMAKVEEVTAAATAAKEESAKQLTDMQAKLAAAEQNAKEEKEKRKRAKEKAVEAQIRRSAAKAGIEDEDYALMLFARAAGKKDEQGNPLPPPNPDEFFVQLAQERPALAKAGAAPVPARTAPQSDPPAPPPPGGAPPGSKEKGVDDLNDRDFAARTRARYGFNPSIGL